MKKIKVILSIYLKINGIIWNKQCSRLQAFDNILNGNIIRAYFGSLVARFQLVLRLDFIVEVPFASLNLQHSIV